jgi:hypothetical protein
MYHKEPDQQFPRIRIPLSALPLPTYHVRPPEHRGPSLLNVSESAFAAS